MQFEETILTLLHDQAAARGPGKTICPSDAARHLAPKSWRPLMAPIRQAAFRLAAAGRLEITQQGRPIDPATARGPIRLRLPQRPQ